MGAYENPTQAIDRESGMIIANAIGRIGQQTSNYLQTYADARNKELEKAKKEEDARLATQEANRDRIHANIQKAGGRSQSWFDLADNAINAKYKYEGLLQDAPDEREIKEDGTIVYSRKELHELINKEKAKIRTLTNGLTDINNWKASQGEKLLNTNTNEPGGIYTGSCSEGSSQFNKSICQDYERKMALMGTLTRDGKVVTDVEYEIREIEGIPSVWAKIEGKDAFNVSDVLAQDYAEAENIFKGDDNDGINFITQETGIFNKDKKLVDSFLEQPFMEDIIDSQTGEKMGIRYIRPVNTDAVLGRLIPEYEAHFLSMVNSVDNKQDYNDLMATYLAYSKDGEDLQTERPGVYKLTDEAKAKFVQQMVGVALEDKIPGYEVISAEENEDGTITYINQEGQEETSDVNTKYSYRGTGGTGKGETFEDNIKERFTGPEKPTTEPKTDTWAVDNYNSFQQNPIGYLQGENMRGFKKSETHKNIITFDITDDEGKVVNTDTFNIQEPNDVKALFLNIDNTQAGRKRADQVYNIAKKEKAIRVKKEKEEEEKRKIADEKARKNFPTKLKSFIDVRKNWNPNNSKMPEELKDMSNIIGGLSDKEIQNLTYEKYKKLHEASFDKFKNKS